MTGKQRTPGAGFFATICMVVIAAYALSIGPACWISSRVGAARFVTIFYKPVTWAVEVTDSDALRKGIQWYSDLGTAGVWTWTFGAAEPGDVEWCQIELFDIDLSTGPPAFTTMPSGTGLPSPATE
jgi:hypothetical protein